MEKKLSTWNDSSPVLALTPYTESGSNKQRTQAPTRKKQEEMFIGMVHYMLPRHSHKLAPLNKVAGIKSKSWKKNFMEAKEMVEKGFFSLLGLRKAISCLHS